MTDTLEIVTCPACGNEMVKIYNSDLGINIDVCVNGCGGVYFDSDEYEIFRDCTDNIETLITFMMIQEPKAVNESEIRTCPSCGSAMVKAYMSGKYKIQIDQCKDCGSVFLDYGELSLLRSANK